MAEFVTKIFRLAWKYRYRLFLGVLCGVIGGLIEPLMIATVTFVYSIVFPSAEAVPLAMQLQRAPEWIRTWLVNAQTAISNGVREHAWAAVALVFTIPAVIFLRGLFAYLNAYLLNWVAIRVVTDLRVNLFAHLVNLSAGFFSRSKAGELISRVSNDTQVIQMIFSQAVAVIVRDPITIISLLAYLFWQHPRITIATMLVMPLCMIPVVIFGRKVRKSSRELQAQAAEMTHMMTEAFTGDRIIKAYNLERTVIERFRGAAVRFVSQFMRIIRSTELPGPLLEFFGALGLALLLLYLAFGPGKRPDSGDFLAVVLGIYAMYRPMKNLARLYGQLQQGRAATERIFQLLALQDSVPEPLNPKALHGAGADIEFDSVEFAYDDKPVLRGVTFTAKAGKVTAIVGASGSGKTTIVNLLLRFYDPQQGSIRIGGVDIREVSIRDLRQQIAVVTQDTILFNDTIRRNIEVGKPNANEDEIVRAAELAHAHEFIMACEKGYDTVIGDKGVMLSGGQRQRIAIARAILKDAPILVLDEATSALDSESERVVQEALAELMKGRTTICIAHRLSTIQNADQIIVIDQGRVVESGTHEELLRRNGVYRRLYELQYGQV